jgi:hypothetical protein
MEVNRDNAPLPRVTQYDYGTTWENYRAAQAVGLFTKSQLLREGYRPNSEAEGVLRIDVPGKGRWIPLYSPTKAKLARHRPDRPRRRGAWWLLLRPGYRQPNPSVVTAITTPFTESGARGIAMSQPFMMHNARWMFVSPPPGTRYHNVDLVALPERYTADNPPDIETFCDTSTIWQGGMPSPSPYNTATILGGPFPDVGSGINALRTPESLPLDTGKGTAGCFRLWLHLPYRRDGLIVTPDASGVLRSPIEIARYDLGEYDPGGGSTLLRLLREGGEWWEPEELIADWQPLVSRFNLEAIGVTLDASDEALLSEMTERAQRWLAEH